MALRDQRDLVGHVLLSTQYWITVSVLLLAPLFFGSIDLFWTAIWLILLSVGVFCHVPVPVPGRAVYVLFAFLGGCAVYGVVAVLQVMPNIFPLIEDPVWPLAAGILDQQPGARISARADIPIAAIGHFFLFVTAFLNGYYVGLSRPLASRLFIYARYSVLIYAVYGLAALVLTPDLILWMKKSAYQGSLTATFINHNTAATYIGAGMILWFASAFATFQSFPLASIRVLLLNKTYENLAVRALGELAATLVCFLALLCTGSRGGLICSCAGLLVTMILLVPNGGKATARNLWWIALSSAFAMAAVVSGLGRVATQGLFDEARWSVYNLCLKAIAQRPLLGYGVGTFSDVFPSLRTSEFYGWGVWEFAHSTILEIAFEMGIPVALMISMAAVASILMLGKAALSSHGPRRLIVCAIAGIATLSYLHSLIDFSLQIPGYEAVFAIMLGCAIAGAVQGEMNNQTTPEKRQQAARAPYTRRRA